MIPRVRLRLVVHEVLFPFVVDKVRPKQRLVLVDVEVELGQDRRPQVVPINQQLRVTGCASGKRQPRFYLRAKNEVVVLVVRETSRINEAIPHRDEVRQVVLRDRRGDHVLDRLPKTAVAGGEELDCVVLDRLTSIGWGDGARSTGWMVWSAVTKVIPDGLEVKDMLSEGEEGGGKGEMEPFIQFQV